MVGRTPVSVLDLVGAGGDELFQYLLRDDVDCR